MFESFMVNVDKAADEISQISDEITINATRKDVLTAKIPVNSKTIRRMSELKSEDENRAAASRTDLENQILEVLNGMFK